MGSPDNITQFQEMAGRILGALYATHPIAQWGESDLLSPNPPISDEDQELFDETLQYLVENGYVRHRNDNYVRLLDKAYEALNETNPLLPQKSLGAALADWSKETASGIGRDTVASVSKIALTAIFAALKQNL